MLKLTGQLLSKMNKNPDRHIATQRDKQIEINIRVDRSMDM